MVLPIPNLSFLTSLARSILATVTVGTLALAVGAMVRRWHHDRFDRRLKSLCIHYALTPATLLEGKYSAQCLARLRTLPLSNLELLLEPLLLKCASAPPLATVLEELCLELGLIDIWQRRILGQFVPVSFREALSNPDGLLHFFPRLHFLLRARSARNLGLLRHQASWPILAKALDDPHPDVQQVALRSLAALREPQSFPALLESDGQSGHGESFAPLSSFSEGSHGQVSAFPSPTTPACTAPPASTGPLGGGGDSARNGEERAGRETDSFPIQERVRPRVGHAHFRC